MDQEQYITDRVDNQQQWYSKKSGINKTYFIWSRGLVIVLSSLIPLGAVFMENDNDSYIKYVLAALGTLVAVISGIAAMMKFQEKWMMYRTTAEALLHEKYIFMTSTGSYHNEKEPFQLFVNRIEALLSEENTNWAETIMEKNE